MPDKAFLAGNLRPDTGNRYTVDDFLLLCPQFRNIVPEVVLRLYIAKANACIQPARWHAQWRDGITLYIAHYCTLWLRTNAAEGTPAALVAENGMSKGAVASKQVDRVSVAYKDTEAVNDLAGWGSYKETLFGQQFATLARMVGKGGMYVI